jgi:hypothetical protein
MRNSSAIDTDAAFMLAALAFGFLVAAPADAQRDPGINQPGAMGNRGVAGVGVGAPGVGVVDPGINQPGAMGNRGVAGVGVGAPGAGCGNGAANGAPILTPVCQLQTRAAGRLPGDPKLRPRPFSA